MMHLVYCVFGLLLSARSPYAHYTALYQTHLILVNGGGGGIWSAIQIFFRNPSSLALKISSEEKNHPLPPQAHIL